jgi:hypothetical protein
MPARLARAEKDQAIDTKKADFFEAELTKLAATPRPRAQKQCHTGCPRQFFYLK